MSQFDKNSLISELCPPLDSTLTTQLLNEFISMEKRYLLGDWEPSTLDGGQFAEAASRIVYHIDSGILNQRKSLNNCLRYVEDNTNQNSHSFPNRKSSLHISKVLRSIYKFRSDRGAVHIDPEYTANHIDSKLVLENSRWILSELLRNFWIGNRAKVASTIRNIVQFQVPAIGQFGEIILVQRTDCTIEEEVLILLYNAGDLGYSRTLLGNYSSGSPASVSKALKKLSSRKVRHIVRLQNGNYRLSDLGIKHLIEVLAPKLSI